MKKFTKVVLCVFSMMILLFSVQTVYAAEVQTTEDGKFTYSCDYYAGTATIHSYLGEETVVTFPSSVDGCKVTDIKSVKRLYSENYYRAYSSVIQSGMRDKVTSIVIPDTVTTIGNNAFNGCTALTDVTMSSKIKHVGGGAFIGCTSLESIDFPKTLETFGAIEGGSGQYSYSHGPFKDCTGLKTVTIDKSSKLTEIPSCSFSRCSALESITIPNSLKKIGREAFLECSSLKVLNLPKSMETIHDNAFNRCTSLGEITLCEGLRIEFWAFANCGVNTITIPKNVSLGNDAFHGCPNLTAVTLSKTQYISKNVFMNCPNLSKLTIKSGVTEIGSGMFEGSAVKTVVIPSTVTKFAGFNNCKNLEKVFILGNPSAVSGITAGSRVTLVSYKGNNVQKYAKEIGVRFQALNRATNLKAINNSKGKVKITWKGVSGVNKYTVYRSTSKDGEYKKIGTVKSKTFTDKTVKKGKTYYYRIAIDYTDSTGVSLTGIESSSAKIKVKK